MNTRLRIKNRETEGYATMFDVLKFDFSMNKRYSKSMGTIDMKTFFSEFSVEVVGDEASRMFLYECYIDNLLVSGDIVVDNSQNSIYDNEPDTRTFEFENARLFCLSERYDLNANDKYCFTIGFVSERVVVDEEAFSFLASPIRI